MRTLGYGSKPCSTFASIGGGEDELRSASAVLELKSVIGLRMLVVGVQAANLTKTIIMSTTPTQRIVPGAPPPPPISIKKSSQKRKKKAAGGATTVVDDISATPSPLVGTQNLEIVTNGASNQGTPPAPSTPAAVSPSLQKLSPIVDLISKRLKTTQKKVVCMPEFQIRVCRLDRPFSCLETYQGIQWLSGRAQRRSKTFSRQFARS